MTSILLVDDDVQFRTMLAEVLTVAGYDVREASDGNQGTRLYESWPADLLITDLVMPDKEGLEMILEMKRMHSGVKIIAISGGGRHGSEDYLKIARAFGAERVLAKPFSHREILEAIKQVLNQ